MIYFCGWEVLHQSVVYLLDSKHDDLRTIQKYDLFIPE